jgi:hypothetical protein
MYHISQAKGLPKESLHHRNSKEPLHQWKSTQAYENHKLSLLLPLVLIAGLGGLNVLLLVPIAGLSSGTMGIFLNNFSLFCLGLYLYRSNIFNGKLS